MIHIGYILRPHGVNGEMKVQVLSDDPARLDGLAAVRIGDGDASELHRVRSVRHQGGDVLLSLEDVRDPESAGKLRGKYLLIEREEAAALPEGAYYVFDLVGCRVFDPSGRELGVLADVLKTGANDVWIVRRAERGAKELLIPALKTVVRSVSVGDKRIVVDLPEGLEEP
jgi:16S rRNA processing protein RimM